MYNSDLNILGIDLEQYKYVMLLKNHPPVVIAIYVCTVKQMTKKCTS